MEGYLHRKTLLVIDALTRLSERKPFNHVKDLIENYFYVKSCYCYNKYKEIFAVSFLFIKTIVKR